MYSYRGMKSVRQIKGLTPPAPQWSKEVAPPPQWSNDVAPFLRDTLSKAAPPSRSSLSSSS